MPYGSRKSQVYEQLLEWLCMSCGLAVRGAIVLRVVSGSSRRCPSRSERGARERAGRGCVFARSGAVLSVGLVSVGAVHQ